MVFPCYVKNSEQPNRQYKNVLPSTNQTIRIMKRVTIDTSGLMKAPIDQKNVLEDALLDNLFDREYFTWEPEFREAVGFIGSFATFAYYHDNVCELSFLRQSPRDLRADDWCYNIVERLTGDKHADCSNQYPLVFQYLDNDNDMVVTITFYNHSAKVEFHFNVAI